METGVVVQEKGNYVVVKLSRKEACDKCRACMAGIEGKDMFIEADNACNAKLGDEVGISLEQSSFLSAVFIMYTIPLVGLFIGIGLGYYIGDVLEINWVEYLSVLIGFVFLGISYLLIRKNEAKFQKKKYRPLALEVVQPRADD